jgi:hypothetical protein
MKTFIGLRRSRLLKLRRTRSLAANHQRIVNVGIALLKAWSEDRTQPPRGDPAAARPEATLREENVPCVDCLELSPKSPLHFLCYSQPRSIPLLTWPESTATAGASATVIRMAGSSK